MTGNQEKEVSVRALCDNGSQVNLITQGVIQQLREKINPEQITFVGVGGKTLGSSLGEVNLKIQLKDGHHIWSKFFVVKNITNYRPTGASHDWQEIREKLADKRYNVPGKINALLGVGVWIKIIEPEIIRSRDKAAIAQKTKLGYVIFEEKSNLRDLTNPHIGAIAKGPSFKRLEETIQKLWRIEEIRGKPGKTQEEKLCEQIFMEGHSRTRSGRYVVRMPFNCKIKMLGKSKKLALQQFFAMENRMKRNNEFAAKYKLFMLEYEALGHMQLIHETSEGGYYTPHHGVLSSGKFRVVFNASAKTTSGTSLNETQLTGEKLQKDLFLILINFRKFKIGITADIEKMYRQVLIHPDDRKYQKILWRPEEGEPVRVYELKTVTYGHTCAPHCAIRALVQCADDNEKQYPMGARLIKENFYVDDLLAGADNEHEVSQIKTELTNVLRLGGFNITKWKSNGNFQESIEFKEGEEPSILGLHWNLKTDKFFFKLRGSTETGVWTKRKILAKIGKMYDPNGYVGPVIMRGKIIIQELWKDKLDWDEEVHGEVKKKWEKFNDDLTNVSQISIDRWMGTTKESNMQLHGFCDASERGYGAVIYSRVREGGKFRTELIISKSRVAPLKVMTIPRLELCSAELLAKLVETIEPLFKGAGQRIQIYCWTDSQVALHWITKPATSFKRYVATRIEKIQDITREVNLQWRWVKGEDNPADLISRGSSVLELQRESKWWKGPEWLHGIDKEWPIQPTFENLNSTLMDNEEIQKEVAIHLVINRANTLTRGEFRLLEVYSTWEKLKRVTIAVFQAARKFQTLKTKKIGTFSIANNLETLAINYLIRLDQAMTFPEEIQAARSNNREKLAKLVLIWDSEYEFLRIDGRVRSDNLTRDQQFPILLGKDGILATLLIRDAHYHRVGDWPGGVGHGGTQLVLQYLREKFWITGAKRLAKSIINKCPICFKFRAGKSDQLMAALPKYRTTPAKVFSKVGIDYAGPVMLRFNLGKFPKISKAWIAVFVCLVTRAIHLELVSDATTKAFIAALRRMMARRGRITHIVSDNGTNFVGANNFLHSILSKIEADIENIEQQGQIKWMFTTPSAPHQGGIYEAAVKSVKHHLTRIIGETPLTFEEYATILCQVEAYVNSRPLCALSDDPTSLNALTPGHFIMGEAPVRLPDEEDYRDTPENRLNRWEKIQKMMQEFWDRWQHEYLTTLTNRTKWTEVKRNFQVGDLVILKEDNVPPLKWKLARVQEVFLGKDKQVRSVVVRTASGVFRRPIVKLALLLENNED